MIQLGLVNELKDKLRDQALRDPLTGLHNRRYLEETLPRELKRAKRNGACLSVIMMNIDHFKTINDTYGHLVGDQTIKFIANLLTSAARASDITCRFGGDEILLAMPDMTSTDVLKRAEHIRQLCEDTSTSQANLERGLISWISPIARALLKAAEGDSVPVRTPAGTEMIEVITIRYEG